MHSVAEELTLLASSGYPIAYLLTWEEERARRIVTEAVKAMESKMAVWTATGGLGANEASRDPVQLLSALKKAPAGVTVLLDFHPFLAQPDVVRRLRDLVPLLARAGHMLVMISPVLVLPEELEKDIALLEVPLPSREELDHLFRQVCVDEEVIFPEEFVDGLIRAAQGLTENESRRVFTKAMRKGGGFKLDDISLIIEEKKKSIRKSEVLEFYELDESLETVGGLEEVKRWLQSRSKAFDEEAVRFGLPPPKGLLLIGVQGCGKSLTAKAVAGSWRLPLIRLDLGAVFGSASPETSLRKALLVIGSLAPVVLWVDEIEKGFSGAGGESAGGAPRVFGTFITWLQEKTAPVFVVATANEVELMPPELLRKGRFDETFFVDLPDVHERKSILEIHIRMRGRDPADFDLDGLARQAEHYSGAELEQGVVAGLYRAFEQERQLETGDIMRELDQIVPLYATYEEKIKGLRDWAKNRARRASIDQSLVDLFDHE
jgi:ATP-dependent 26S proteasome regulatory subunit